MTAVKPESGSALHGYWGSDGSQHVNFIGVDFHLHELYIAPNTAGWTDNDLTQLAAGQLAGVGPALNTALAGYWGSDNSQHVHFLAVGIEYNHVHELSITPGSGWVNNDITSLAPDGSVPLGGRALSSYWGSDGSQHVNFFGFSGQEYHVQQLSIAPGAGWVLNDLTSSAGGVAPVVDPPPPMLVSYWGSDGSQHVNFIGLDGHIHELYIAPSATGWVDHDLTVLAAAVAPGERALDAYWGTDSSQHVNFIGLDGHIHELYIAPSATGWTDNDLTMLAGAVPILGGTALNGYWGSDNSQHVNFIGTDGDVHELYIVPGAPGWVDNNLTALA
jgi:hypothetical protein